jgi:5'-3' exonuclease
MGIKYFYKWFCDNIAKDCISFTPPIIDNLYVDINSIIYESAEYVYHYGEYYHVKHVGGQQAKSGTENDLYKEIILRVDNLTKFIKPKFVYIALDGIAPSSKQRNQKQRRCHPDQNDLFDVLNLTTGTKFMKRLSKYLVDHFSKFPGYKISGTEKPGEGEHKLMNTIRASKSNKSRCVVSCDGDVIMTCLLLNRREDTYLFRNNVFIKIHSNLDRDNDAYKNLPIPVKDFVVLLCMIGNDHLPQVLALDVNIGGINLLINSYKKINESLVDLNGTISLPVLIKIVKELFKFELDQIRKLFNDETRFPSLIPFKSFSIDYNRENLNDTPEDAAYEYVKGLQFVLDYYSKGVQDWSWYYPYDYAPLLADIKNIDTAKRIEFEINSPCTEVEQLLRILPQRALKLIPKTYRHHFTRIDRSYSVDLSLKRYENEAVYKIRFENYVVLGKI